MDGGRFIPIRQGGTDDRDTLRALCVRKTPRSVQREVYEALKRTFGEA